CHTPVISGVGHETDFTIADFVADQRAATPTAAAVAATPDGPELLVQLGRSRLRLTRAVEQTLQRQMQRLDHADKRLHQQHPRRRLDELTRRQTDLARRSTLAIKRQLDSHSRRLQGLESRLFARHPDRQLQRLEQQLAAAHTRLKRAADHAIERREQQLAAVVRSLNNVSPLAVLERGYAVVRDSQGQALTERRLFEKGKKINLLMSSFEVDAEVASTPRDARLK